MTGDPSGVPVTLPSRAIPVAVPASASGGKLVSQTAPGVAPGATALARPTRVTDGAWFPRKYTGRGGPAQPEQPDCVPGPAWIAQPPATLVNW